MINSSVEFAKATGATNSALDVKSVNRVTANNSRIGFKGWEDLGNGLKAIWQVEQNVDIDTGNSSHQLGQPQQLRGPGRLLRPRTAGQA